MNIPNPYLNSESARKYLESRLWKAGATCPKCKAKERITIRKGGFYRCNACKLDFTVRTGTIFERSHVPLHKWLYAIHIFLLNISISTLEMARKIDITQKSSWLVLDRLKKVPSAGLEKLREITYIDDGLINNTIVKPTHSIKTNEDNTKWMHYIRTLDSLKDGDFIEISVISKKELKSFRTSLSVMAGQICFATRTSNDGKTIRIYKTGTWKNRTEAIRISDSIMVVCRILWWQRPALFGLLCSAPSMHISEAETLRKSCEIKACPFPRHGKNKKCQYHLKFFYHDESLIDRSVDFEDIFSSEENPEPRLYLTPIWKDKSPGTRFLHNGMFNKGAKISDDYWREIGMDDKIKY